MKLKEVQVVLVSTNDKKNLVRYYKTLGAKERYAVKNSLDYLNIKVKGINK